MKWFSAILAVLVLFLSVQPVCAAELRPSAGDSCCTSTCADEPCQDKEKQHDEGKSCKGCNPFQSCACCAAGALPTQLLAAPIVQRLGLTDSPSWRHLLPGLPQTAMSDFWQPPRAA